MIEEDIIQLVKNDQWMMSVLKEAEKLNLPDWLIGAGFLRNKVWDYLHGYRKDMADTHDIDLVYFDKENINEEFDKGLSQNMKGVMGLDWEIVNQAYTHKWHNRDSEYKDTKDAISEWVETSTCIGVRIINDEVVIVAPHGIDDLVNLRVKPAPAFVNKMDIFKSRYKSKKWLEKWPKLKVVI